MRAKNEKIKIGFYILSLIGILILIGLFVLGFLLDIYNADFDKLPKYKLFIFGGCVALSFGRLKKRIKFEKAQHKTTLPRRPKETSKPWSSWNVHLCCQPESGDWGIGWIA
jgi:hypothetical protein